MTSKQLVPLVGLVLVAVVLRLVAGSTAQLVGCAIAAVVAAGWLDCVSPGHRWTRLGRPRPFWLVVVTAPIVVQLLVLPLLGDASLGVVVAVFLAGLTLVSARNNYGHANST